MIIFDVEDAIFMFSGTVREKVRLETFREQSLSEAEMERAKSILWRQFALSGTE